MTVDLRVEEIVAHTPTVSSFFFSDSYLLYLIHVGVQMVALRRLLAAGRLLRKLGVAGVTLVNEVGFRDEVCTRRSNTGVTA